MNLFHRYIIKEHIAPFVFAFSVIMFVLILKLMLQLMDMLITRGIGIIIMAKLLMYSLAWMVALVVPMSVLISTLMAFGRMGAAGEITAMKAAGISMYFAILSVPADPSPVVPQRSKNIVPRRNVLWWSPVVQPYWQGRGSVIPTTAFRVVDMPAPLDQGSSP